MPAIYTAISLRLIILLRERFGCVNTVTLFLVPLMSCITLLYIWDWPWNNDYT